MKKTSLIVLITILIAIPLSAQKKYAADPSATQINWTGKKLGKEHFGTINLKEGVIHIDNNAITGGEFHVDMTTIKNTDLEDEKMNGMLVGHLKSDDFFGTQAYPTAKLVITQAKDNANGQFDVKANLTIRDVTLPISFMAQLTPNGKKYNATTNLTIDRSKFNVKYGSGSFFDGLGDSTIYDEFDLAISLVTE